MKTILFSIVTLIASVSFAGEGSIEAWIKYNNERALSLEACIAGDNARCECASLTEGAINTIAAIDLVERKAEAPLRKCLRSMSLIGLGDGPATTDYNLRSQARQTCPAATAQAVAEKSAELAPKHSRLVARLETINSLKSSFCSK